jgi:N-sulfoglucosamine sulfohydrolase
MKRLLIIFAILAAASPLSAQQPTRPSDSARGRPNIVWIVGEDMGPDVGAYGDANARTPNLDALAKQGALFTRAFTHAPVCAPSRSGLITGMYPTTIGTHHMRSVLLKPPPMFTDHLTKAGYAVAWPGKTDFNFPLRPGGDTNWLDTLPAEPFFAYMNFNVSHESQIRSTEEQFAKNTARLKPEDRHDPSKMVVPPFYPDAPEVRRDIARYYDLVTAVDYRVGDVLAALDRAGVADNTIVVFFGDHGRGMPRYKRWVYDTGIKVPLIVRWPRGHGFAPGTVRDDLVSFVDFAPTMLSIARVPVPKEMQGQVFLGPGAKKRTHVFAHRDRMDETYDRIRAVRDSRYKYIRNFHPELPYAQRIQYAEEMPTLQVWRKWNAEGKLKGPQRIFFSPTKPKEELYETGSDPYEINNLAESPEHQSVLRELRVVLDRWMEETRDMGSIPESEMVKRRLVKDMTEQYKDRIRN